MTVGERLAPKWKPGGAGASGLRVLARAADAGIGVVRRLSPALAKWVEGMAPRLRFAWGGLEYEVRPGSVETHPRQGEGWGDNPRHNYADRFEDRPVPGAAVGIAAEPRPRPRPHVDPAAEATAGPAPAGPPTAATGAPPRVTPAPAAPAPAAPSPVVGPPPRVVATERAQASGRRRRADPRAPAEPGPRAPGRARKVFATPDEGADRPPVRGARLDRAAMERDVAARMGRLPDAPAAAPGTRSRTAEELQAEIGRLRHLLQGLDDVEDFDLIKSIDQELYQLHRAVEYKMKLHRASEAKAELGKLFKV